MKRKVLMKWLIVEDYCACLIFEGGNPDNIEDRVAFIEKTPRVLINGEWIQGYKGNGGVLHLDGYSIYGFYKPSRDWCEKMILENYEVIEDNSLVENIKTKNCNFTKKLKNVKNYELFLNTFYYSKEEIEYSVEQNELDYINLREFSAINKEDFLNIFEQKILSYKSILEKELKLKTSKFDSVKAIKFSNGKIFIEGKKNRKFNKDLTALFLNKLNNDKVAIVYKNFVQNGISSNKVVIFNYLKENKELTFEYRGIKFYIKIPEKINNNMFFSLRKIFKKDNFYDILNSLFKLYLNISIIK